MYAKASMCLCNSNGGTGTAYGGRMNTSTGIPSGDNALAASVDWINGLLSRSVRDRCGDRGSDDVLRSLADTPRDAGSARPLHPPSVHLRSQRVFAAMWEGAGGGSAPPASTPTQTVSPADYDPYTRVSLWRDENSRLRLLFSLTVIFSINRFGKFDGKHCEYTCN